MENPFVYGEVVPAASFVDRIDELDRLVRDLSSGQKVFLISPRRYGKSSLIRQALRAVGRGGALTAEVTVSSYSSYLAFLEGYTRVAASNADRLGQGAQLAQGRHRRRKAGAAPRGRLDGRHGVVGEVPERPHRTRHLATRGRGVRAARGASAICARPASSSRSTSFRRSTDSTAAASSTRCAPPSSISAASVTCSRAPSPA